MEQSIASYLFRNGSCILPGIGELKIIKKPADTDFINKEIKAPVEIIDFYPSKGKSSVFNELTAVSEHLRMLLNTKRTVILSGVGTFSKDDHGTIHFLAEKIDLALTQPVFFERINRQEIRPEIIPASDSSKNINEADTQIIEKIPVKKYRWSTVALVIGIIGMIIILIHITQNGATTGNINNINASDAPTTYHTIK